MKFKFDENMPAISADLFRNNNFDACTVRTQNLTGCSDDKLMSVCTDEERILVTLDLDFSDIRKYQPETLKGIIVIPSERQGRDNILGILKRMMPILQTETIEGKLMIVEDDKIRIR